MNALGSFFSILMGLSLGLFGAGGSILTVPILTYIYKMDPSQSTTLSLMIVGVVAASSIFVSQLKNPESAKPSTSGEKQMGLSLLITFAFITALGVWIGKGVLVPTIPASIFGISKNNLLMIIFALLMIWASSTMIFKSAPKQASQPSMPRLLSVGILVGIVTGLVGVGGGFLLVPALVNQLKFSPKRAIEISLMIITLNCVVGTIAGWSSIGNFSWSLLASVLGPALIGMLLGLQVRSKVNADLLKRGFGVFVLLLGSYILWKSVH